MQVEKCFWKAGSRIEGCICYYGRLLTIDGQCNVADFAHSFHAFEKSQKHDCPELV